MKMACAPGDQLANVLHSDDQSSLFMDSAWRDPNLNSAAYTPAAPSSASLPGNMQSSTFNNSHQAVLQPLPSLGGHGTSLSAASNAASDPFSQLSLSRMPVGNAPPQQYGVDVQPGSSSLLGMGSTWPSTATSKLASSGHSISAGMSARRGAAPLERPSHDQPRTSQTASFSLI